MYWYYINVIMKYLCWQKLLFDVYIAEVCVLCTLFFRSFYFYVLCGIFFIVIIIIKSDFYAQT